jgi:hypothetical protein
MDPDVEKGDLAISQIREARKDRSGRSSNRLNPENPGLWALHLHKPNLLMEIKKPKSNFVSKMCSKYLKSPCGTVSEECHDDPTDRRFRVSFAELQRMQLRKLQCILVRDVIKMYDSGKESGEWEKTLHQYGKYCPLVN